MMMKLKQLLAFLISLMPFNIVRVALYRLLFRYKISWSAHIGFMTRIYVKTAEIRKGVSIGRNNRFIGPFVLVVGESTRIGSANQFICDFWVLRKELKDIYACYCYIEDNVLITNGHYFDVPGGLKIGSDTWIAGYASQFWTHGLGVEDRAVSIGRNCYLASAIRLLPGAKISDNTVVGVGSIVTKKIEDENILLTGVPATIKKKNYEIMRFKNARQ